MPSAYDRTNVSSQGDHSPLAGLLDFESVNDTAKAAGKGPQSLLHNVASLFGLGGIADLLGSVTPEDIWHGIVNTLIAPLNFFAQLVGGFVSVFQIPLLDASKILNLPQLFLDVTDGFKAIFNGWFGSGAHGTPNEVRQTVEAIKVAVSNGYTLQTVTVNGTFTIPTGTTELNGIVIGAGDNGTYGGVQGGAGASRTGGPGGHGGPYVFKQLDLTDVLPGTVLTCEVGAGPSGSGTVGGMSQIKKSDGTVLLSSAAGTGGISLPQGLTSTTSSAGHGGDGGDATVSTATAGKDGTASGIANGGAGGNGRVQGGAGNFSANNGQAGGAGQSSNVPMCGGGGGGGGGGAGTNSSLVAPFGGKGGNGGFPGGGGGGSGAGAGGTGTGTGAYGIGANGIIAFLYK